MVKLKLEKLSKKYGNIIGLDDFSYDFEPGVYGILGPNGAGKTTLMNIMGCFLKQDSGLIYYDGNQVGMLDKEYRRALGYMPQVNILYPNYTVRDFLLYIAALKDIDSKSAVSEIEYVIETVNLIQKQNTKIKELSGGMRRRVMLAQSILGSPEILILDEPSTGLDPFERVRMRNLISELSKDRIVLLSTHIVSDVELIAGNIIFMNSGKLIVSGKPADICSKLDYKVYEIECSKEEYEKCYKNKYSITMLKAEKDKYIIRFITQKQYENGAVCAFPSLEDVYLRYFNE